MNSTKDTLPKSEGIPTKGKWEKYIGIALIALSITALIATPKAMRWLILLEGIIGIVGIALFIYARIKFWWEVKKLIK